ncbi:ABC transporter ATP-binding protein [Mangrovimonas yunxiaonensis]|uniref:ABC transporter ATP-binding protein n=1 Tax=Mangrovimonas yunxiaonensis TaxID=1197477 RepID=A0A084THL6_9FLAO|nr:HAD-IA family hydrolase [Mangrovimonas yunxiaonensis]KFB00202.1 ABC transporter ATP-binding protein [Mangrovimonas yunxiaonensis]GGH42506.1 ABC transporter ATP-binding protein [Mangrovimonas yunxiaonensis]
MLKAVLFDMDGVIVNTEPLHHKAYYQMFNQVNIHVPDAYYRAHTGSSTINICRQIKQDFNLPHTPETLVQLKRDSFKELFKNDPSLQLIEGVLDLIKDYYHNGLKLVLASSAHMNTINSVFDRFELAPYFDAKFSGADLKASKPHPEIFIKAAASTGFNKQNCMVIEDSTNGIKAAKSAGIFCVGYDSKNSKAQDYSLADKVIDDFSSIHYHKIVTLHKQGF